MKEQIDERTRQYLLTIYANSRKIEIAGRGGGWVDLGAFGYAANRFRINYRGSDGKGNFHLSF